METGLGEAWKDGDWGAIFIYIVMFMIIGGLIFKLAEAIGFIYKDNEKPEEGSGESYFDLFKTFLLIVVWIIVILNMLNSGCFERQ